jgi:hypothetical protein
MDSSYQNGMTAQAGGAQLGATSINRTYSRFTVIVTTGDSCVLPPAGPGLEYCIKNAHGSNSLNVFPAAASQGGFAGDGPNRPAGDSINALAVNTAFSLGPGKACRFFSVAPGTWETLPTAP